MEDCVEDSTKEENTSTNLLKLRRLFGTLSLRTEMAPSAEGGQYYWQMGRARERDFQIFFENWVCYQNPLPRFMSSVFCYYLNFILSYFQNHFLYSSQPPLAQGRNPTSVDLREHFLLFCEPSY